MNRMCVSAVALLVLAGAAHGGVELRFRTRTQSATGATNASSGVTLTTAWSGATFTTAQPVGSFIEIAVQARVTGGRMLSGFDFDIVMPTEAESAGQLWISRISNGGAYTGNGSPWVIGGNPNPGAAGVGLFGVASTFSYLPGLQAPKFNGSINDSSGTFTNNAAMQEIGLIGGLASGSALLSTPGIDDGFTGSPGTFTGPFVTVADPPGGPNPVVGKPENGSTASVDPDAALNYFGQEGWIDIYRLRYTITSNSLRTVPVQLRDPHASTFTQFVYAGGTQQVWGVDSQTDAITILNPNFSFNVTPAPSTVALMGLGGLVISRRRRA